MSLPVKLAPSFRPKVWGSTDLAPWFPEPAERTGEVWFEADPPLPVLIKFLFTSEKLSVQVHPPDRGETPGKTEMWYVLRAAPGASLGLGLRERVDRERLREASLSGGIMDLMEWFPAAPGETYFVPAGTVHAIGGGLALCEIQQNSDVTYRLYDYGRGREVHLEEGLCVADRCPHPGRSAPQQMGAGHWLLAECPYFATELLDLAAPVIYHPEPRRFSVFIAAEGCGELAGQPCRPGDVWLVPAGSEPFEMRPQRHLRLLRTGVP